MLLWYCLEVGSHPPDHRFADETEIMYALAKETQGKASVPQARGGDANPSREAKDANKSTQQSHAEKPCKTVCRHGGPDFAPDANHVYQQKAQKSSIETHRRYARGDARHHQGPKLAPDILGHADPHQASMEKVNKERYSQVLVEIPTVFETGNEQVTRQHHYHHRDLNQQQSESRQQQDTATSPLRDSKVLQKHGGPELAPDTNVHQMSDWKGSEKHKTYARGAAQHYQGPKLAPDMLGHADAHRVGFKKTKEERYSQGAVGIPPRFETGNEQDTRHHSRHHQQWEHIESRRQDTAPAPLLDAPFRTTASRSLDESEESSTQEKGNVATLCEPPEESLAVALEVSEEPSERGPVAIAEKATYLGNRKVRIGIVAAILVLCGVMAGIVVAVVPKRNESTSPALPFTPKPPTMNPVDETPPPMGPLMDWNQVGQSLSVGNATVARNTGPRGELYFGWSVDLSSNGTRLAAVSPYLSSVYIYDLEDGFWNKTATVTDIKGGLVEHIALSGNGAVLVMGFPVNNDTFVNGGKVQVYEIASGIWQKKGSPIYGTKAGESLGGFFDGDSFVNPGAVNGNEKGISVNSYDSSSLALSDNGEILAVGSYVGNYVTVFRYDVASEQWINTTTFVGEVESDKFGTSVALSADGNRIVIGAPNNIGGAKSGYFNTGLVRAFQYLDEQKSWIQLGQDIDGIAGTGDSGEQVGSSVSISEDGSTISVAANLQAGSEDMLYLGKNDGYVKIYEFDESKKQWLQHGNTINAIQFGLVNEEDKEVLEEVADLTIGLRIEKFPIVARLSGDGKRVVMSTLADSLSDISGRGVARLYEIRGETWELVAEPVEGSAEYDQSGRSVALSFDGSLIAIGSPRHNTNSPDDGQVQVFELQAKTTQSPTLAPSPTPTHTPAPSNRRVPIIVFMTVYPSEYGTWSLECGGASIASERMVVGDGTEDPVNVTETFLVDDGSVCKLLSSLSTEFYQVLYGDDMVMSPTIIKGESFYPWDGRGIPFMVAEDTASVTVIIQEDENSLDIAWSVDCGPLFLVERPPEDTGRRYEISANVVMGIKEGSLCEFTISDSFGDGICCENGRGFYRVYYDNVTLPGGLLLAKGDVFESEEKKSFTVSAGAPTSAPVVSHPLLPITLDIRSGGKWSLICNDELLAICVETELGCQDTVETIMVEEGAECILSVNEDVQQYKVYLGDSVAGGFLIYDSAVEEVYEKRAQVRFQVYPTSSPIPTAGPTPTYSGP